MTKKDKPKSSESEEQIAVIDYCDSFNIPIYHITNEGKRSKYTGGTLKRMGLRKGFPDLCVPVPKGRFHGFYIEMKVDNNKPSNDQMKWLKILKNNGYATAICYSADEAIKLIEKYMKLRKE